VSELIRAFIAVELPEEARRRLFQAIELAGGQGLSGVRWVRPEGMHLTLKFLGEIAPSMVERVTEALQAACQGAGPFQLALSHVGAFPDLRMPRVLWVSLSGELEPLRELQGRIESAMQRLGFPAERRRFSPHITLGRVRDGVSPGQRRRVGDAFGKTSVEGASPWHVEGVSLMRSTLTPEGAIYDHLSQIALPQVLPENGNG